MKRVIIAIVLLVVVGIAVYAVVALTQVNETRASEVFLREYKEGHYLSSDRSEDIVRLGYRKLPDGWYGVDFQKFNLLEGGEGATVIRGILHKKGGSQLKLVAVAPVGKAAPPRGMYKEIPDNILEALNAWPLNQPLHTTQPSIVDFYSGDLSKKTRKKLVKWFADKTIDTRVPNMTVQPGSYQKSTGYPTTVRFVLEIKRPQQSRYEIIQQSYTRLSPRKDVIYVSCLDEEIAKENDEIVCLGGVIL